MDVKSNGTKMYNLIEELYPICRSITGNGVRETLEIIKKANSRGHLSGKVADLGCGTGRLAIGAAILGADVTGFEIDAKALDIAIQYSRENNLDIKWVNGAIENIVGHEGIWR